MAHASTLNAAEIENKAADEQHSLSDRAGKCRGSSEIHRDNLRSVTGFPCASVMEGVKCNARNVPADTVFAHEMPYVSTSPT